MSQAIFKNPYVVSAPVLTGGSVGNGTLTIDKLTHYTIDQEYTAICTAISPFTVFNIIGSLDGAVGVAVVGTQFKDEDLKVFLTIQQGPTLFQIGDTFEFEVGQGTDVNQQNIDSYDELPQKNFGQGVLGQNKGDHNIRFNPSQVAAFKQIQNLLFTAQNLGPNGNTISIEYIQGSLLTAAQLILQDLTFTANNLGTVGNAISMEYEDWTPGIKSTVNIQDIKYDADVEGPGGDLISIQYTAGATAGAEVVTVTGNLISVQIEDGVSTVNQIRLALASFPAAAALIDTDDLGTGFETQTIQGPTFLSGGANPIGAAGNEVVTVIGNAIKVKFQSGVSTASQIKTKIDANPSALTLITTTISGNASTVQTAPIIQTNLLGGANNVGEPGNEIVNVVGNAIQVTFNSGLSTANQIKTKIEASVPAAALVALSLVGLGTTFQTAPVSETFLTSGRESGTYAFNKAELTDAGNFYEGNADILVTGITNQGDELTLGVTDKKGKVTLDDQNGLNLSGPSIDNAQKTINNLIQNHKVFLVTEDNSKVSWNKPNLTFTANIAFVFPETNILNKILIANSPIVIADGQHCYVTVNRLVNSNLTPVVANTIPTGENIFRLFSRRGDYLIWYDNTLQKDTKAIRLGEGGGGGTAYQEKIGTGNNIVTNFPLTFIPSNEYSILVISSYIREEGVEYIYNPIGNQIEFQPGYIPAAGQDVYVFYLTEGETLIVPTPSGLLNSYIHTVTLGEETAKELTLINTPVNPSKVLVDIITGGAQEFNLDFTISVDKFQWGGYGLDGDLVSGDKIRFYFYS